MVANFSTLGVMNYEVDLHWLVSGYYNTLLLSGNDLLSVATNIFSYRCPLIFALNISSTVDLLHYFPKKLRRRICASWNQLNWNVHVSPIANLILLGTLHDLFISFYVSILLPLEGNRLMKLASLSYRVRESQQY